MRVLLTVQPAHGHLNPMLGLSAALRDADHEVLFATSAPFVDAVRSRGERAAAVGIDWLENEGATEPAPADDPTGGRTIFRRLFLGDVAAAAATDLVELIGEYRPDLLVRESFEFGGAAAASRCGIPLATFDLSFPTDFQVMVTTGDVEDAGPLDELRDRTGLPASTDPDWFLGDLVISTFPAHYRGQRGRTPDVTIRPTAVDLLEPAPAPAWMDDLEGAVYVTLGTVFPRWFPEVLEVTVRGAVATGRPTVVTHGPSIRSEDLDLPDHPDLHVAEYVPQGPLLERCAAAVVHGGTGTTLGALVRGVPLVVVPMGADQFAHADAVERFGAGRRLGHDGLQPDQVTAALESLLEDPGAHDAAREVGRDFRDLPGPAHAVPFLEALVH